MTCKILAEVKLLAVWLFACVSVAVGEQKTDAPVVFSLKAPHANKVELCGEWARQNIPLNRGDDGTWSVSLESVPAGGWQSLTIGLGALDRFAWVGAFSSSADVEAVQPVLDAPRESDQRLRLLWLACGRNDRFLKGNEAIVGALSSSGIHHQWHLTDGGHSWPVWRGYLVEIAPLLFQE